MYPNRRKSFNASTKLKAINYAKMHSNRKAADIYGCDEKSIREWRKNEAALTKANPNQRAARGKCSQWPELEFQLKNWILDLRSQSISVSTIDIRQRAFSLAIENNIEGFRNSLNWIYKFMRRNDLTIRSRTTVGQRLPDNWMTIQADFLKFVNKELEEHLIMNKDIINMDEVSMSFDVPTTRTVSERGVKTVHIATTGNERNSFTVVLGCTADGRKLKPLIIFKRLTMPREKFPNDLVVVCNKKGWMNEEVMKTWISKCFRTRPGAFFTKKSLLILDSMSTHRLESIKTSLNCASTHLAFIPGGLTSKLQPLDISVNHPFKSFIRKKWNEWMKSGDHTFTKSGKQRKASLTEICEWVVTAWQEIQNSTIINGFVKAGIITKDIIEDLSDVDEIYEINEEEEELMEKYFPLCDYESDFDGFSENE